MFNMCYMKWRQENEGLVFIIIIIILSNTTEAVIWETFSPTV